MNKKEREDSLKYSIWDKGFFSAMQGFGESYFGAFAVFLRATTFQIGLIGALPHVMGAIPQLFAYQLTQFFKSRKKLVVWGAFLSALMYLPLTFIFLLDMNIWLTIAAISLYWFFGTVVGPAWNSWMGDLLQVNERATYFAKRNRLGSLVTFITYVAGGFILEHYSNSVQVIGFSILFFLSFIFRLVSVYFLQLKYDPPYETAKVKDFSLKQFLSDQEYHDFRTFTLYVSLISFTTYIAGPYFTPYMLTDVAMSYATFTIINASTIILKFVWMPIWGRACDEFGNAKVLGLSGMLIPLVPLWWLISPNTYYLIFASAYAGFAWAAFDSAALNFLYDATEPLKRVKSIAYYNVLNGVAVLLGTFVGGIIVKYNTAFWSKYLLVMMISGILRLIVSTIFIPKIREFRQVKPIKKRKLLLDVVSKTPTMGYLYQVVAFRRKRK